MSLLLLSDVATDATPEAALRMRLRVAAAVAIAAVAVLNLFDILTTRAVLAHGAIESNPLAKFLLPGGKVEAVKVLILIGLGWRVAKRPPSIAFAAGLWFAAGFFR